MADPKQKEFYETLYSEIMDGVYIHRIAEDGTPGKILLVNEVACKTLGYTKDELLTMDASQIDAPESRVDVRQIIADLKHKRNILFEQTHVAKDGHRIPVEINVRAFKFKDQDVIMSVVRDITERKKSQQMLDLLKYSIDHSQDAAFWTTPEGRFVYVNDAACRSLGYHIEELLQMYIWDVTPVTDTSPQKWLDTWQILREKKTIHSESTLRRKDGLVFPVEITSTFVIFEEREFNCEFARDITERKMAEETIYEQQQILELILEQSLAGYWDWWIQEDKEYLSPTFKKMFGYEDDELPNVPESWKKIIFQEDLPGTIETFRKHVESRGQFPYYNEVRYHHKSGATIWVICTGKVIQWDENGSPIRMIGCHLDITKRKHIESNLRTSEERFSKAFQSSPMSISITKMKNNEIIDVNDAFEELFYLSRAEIVGHTAEEIGIWDNIKDRETILHILTRDGIVKNKEINMRSRRGNLVTIDFSAVNVELAGEPCILTSMIDLTARIKAEGALRESEEKFRTITEQSSLGILIIQDDILKYMNNTALSITRMDKNRLKDFHSENMAKFVHPDDLPVFVSLLQSIKSKTIGYQSQFAFRVQNSRDSIRWIELYPKIISYENNPAVLIILNDVTDTILKKMAIQESENRIRGMLEEEVKKLKYIDHLRTEFVYRASHELKTPLNAICSASSLLKNYYSVLSEDEKELVEVISKGGDRLKRLIDNLIESFRIDAHLIFLKKEKMDLVDVIAKTIEECSALLIGRKHNILVDLPDSLEIEADREKLMVVINNLIINAINNTPPPGQINIGLRIQGNNVELSVADNGVGFTTEEKTRLFQKFGKIERYGTGRNIVTEGSGIGLYITKNIIEQHGGTIQVKSEGRDCGCVFIVSLPYKQ